MLANPILVVIVSFHVLSEKKHCGGRSPEHFKELRVGKRLINSKNETIISGKKKVEHLPSKRNIDIFIMACKGISNLIH